MENTKGQLMALNLSDDLHIRIEKQFDAKRGDEVFEIRVLKSHEFARGNETVREYRDVLVLSGCRAIFRNLDWDPPAMNSHQRLDLADELPF